MVIRDLLRGLLGGFCNPSEAPGDKWPAHPWRVRGQTKTAPRTYVPYSKFHSACGFFDIPFQFHVWNSVGDKASGYCPMTRLSELKQSLERYTASMILPGTLVCGPVWGLSPRPPAQQSDALPTEVASTIKRFFNCIAVTKFSIFLSCSNLAFCFSFSVLVFRMVLVLIN